MKLKYLFILLLFAVSLFSCGGYYYAENYKFINISEEELINKILKFKEGNPQYSPIYKAESGEILDGFDQPILGEANKKTRIRNDSSIFYTCYFYFSDIKAHIFCVINISRQAPSNSPTILKFGGITYSENFGSWKTINKKGDLTPLENEKIKKKLESEILDHLGKWEHY